MSAINIPPNTSAIVCRGMIALLFPLVAASYAQLPGNPNSFNLFVFPLTANPSGAPAPLGTPPLATSRAPTGGTKTQLTQLFGSVMTGPGSTIPAELKGLLENAPYNRNESLDNQYPRVASTVLTSPPNHGEPDLMGLNGGYVPTACRQLTARTWSSFSSSKDVGPFAVCMPAIDAVANGVPEAGFGDWLRAEETLYWPSKGQETTGDQRTLGPISPDAIFPQGTKHAAYYK